MAITYRQSATAGNASGGNLTINKPTGTLDNDIMVVALYSEYSSTAWTLPAGWAWWGGATGQKAGAENAWNFSAWKRASGEGSNYTFTHGGTAWRIGCISSFVGAFTSGDPEDSTGPTGYSCPGVPYFYPVFKSITTASGNDMLIGCTGDFNGFTLDAGASGLTLAAQLGGCGIIYGIQAAAGASGDKVANLSSNSIVWSTWFQAIKEAAAVTVTHNLAIMGVGT